MNLVVFVVLVVSSANMYRIVTLPCNARTTRVWDVTDLFEHVTLLWKVFVNNPMPKQPLPALRFSQCPSSQGQAGFSVDFGREAPKRKFEFLLWLLCWDPSFPLVNTKSPHPENPGKLLGNYNLVHHGPLLRIAKKARKNYKKCYFLVINY